MIRWSWTSEARWFNNIGNKFKIVLFSPIPFPNIEHIKYIPETNQIEIFGFFSQEKNIMTKYNDKPSPQSSPRIS